MQYTKVTFFNTNQDVMDILVALLSEEGYEGFEEAGDQLHAFIPSPDFNEALLAGIAGVNGLSFETETIGEQNWNEVWESGFQPVVLEGFCTIRAHFHEHTGQTPFDIVITPKMSFGTGHHATTVLMMQLMRTLDFNSKVVFDFGTGTGILAILAEMLGAAEILAVDIDEWPVANTRENAARNECSRITVLQGSLEDIPGQAADIILANINRHILLRYMPDFRNRLLPGGQVLLSGLLAEDREIIQQAALDNGLIFRQIRDQDNWIAMLFDRGE